MDSHSEQHAFVIFGAVCAGKTTLANHLETFEDVEVVATDRLIYERDLLARKGHVEEPITLYRRRVRDSRSKYLVLDEMPKKETFDFLAETERVVTAIYLVQSDETRRARISQRLTRQAELVATLSKIVGTDLTKYDRADRREFWRTDAFADKIADEEREDFETTLRELYLTGGHLWGETCPSPLDFTQIDFHLEISGDFDLKQVRPSDLLLKRIPSCRYALERGARRRRLAVCIWDIGNVLYKYSLKPLQHLTLSNSSRPERFEHAKREFSFNPYMKGEISFTDFCREYCRVFNIDYDPGLEIKIEQALREGIGESSSVCKSVIDLFDNIGVANAVLSNALPILEGDGGYEDLIPENMRFYSFNLGLLKPDNRIYREVLERLDVGAEDALFIDDKARNVLAAMNVGITSVVFSPDNLEKTLRKMLPFTIGT